jgi:arylsulfatase A-like enzyme
MPSTNETSQPRRWMMAFAFSAVAAAGAACAPVYVRAVDGPTAEMPSTSVTRHVVVVSIDGLRPDAIAQYSAPTLQRLVREGSYTLTARTITPSKTLPSHTSMLTGEPPERHHVLWNTGVPTSVGRVDVPTIFGVARAHGYRTAAFFSKSKFQPLQQAGTLDYSQAPGGWFGRWSSERTLHDLETHLASAKPNLLFVHLAEPDRAGHAEGWMTLAYGRAVAVADGAVARIIAAADNAFGKGQYALIVTADHGGHGRDHGSDDPRDVTIPWVAWGQGVKAGQLPDTTVRTMDTASTALWLLGVAEPQDWLGTPVSAAFLPPAGALVTQ